MSLLTGNIGLSLEIQMSLKIENKNSWCWRTSDSEIKRCDDNTK
jgi:hypothetical protein